MKRRALLAGTAAAVGGGIIIPCWPPFSCLPTRENEPEPTPTETPTPTPTPDPRKTYKVAVHYDNADHGKKAAMVAAAYTEMTLAEIWPTKVVVGQELPPSLTKDENYIPEYQQWARDNDSAHQHVLVASTVGSHGWTSYCRVSHSDDLAELEPKWQKLGRGWEHGVVSTLLHEVAHGLGTNDGENAPDHGDGTRIEGCQTPMDSHEANCFAHTYSDVSAQKIRAYMESEIGYE